jgi:hypothetical protein
MYQYHKPSPIVVKLTDENGLKMRQMAADYLKKNLNKKGAERGSGEEQGFGLLAEIVVRKMLGMPEFNSDDHPLAYDLLLSNSIKLDVKCRGGSLPFKEEYESGDGISREAKHNFFARQIYDDSLDTDIYLMTHLETPKDRVLPGTKRQRKWILYICGWVSKKRVTREGVYLPRGSLTEQGNTWFTYRGQEIEFYNRNLNGLRDIKDLLEIERSDVEEDEQKIADLNLTSVDAIRIAYDLVGRGVLNQEAVDYVKKEVEITETVKPILHPNQYYHFLKWLKEKGKIGDTEFSKIRKLLDETEYSGI